MARKKQEYVSKAKTSAIAATSRCSVKIRDNFYTLEWHEERVVPEVDGIDIAKEREALWEIVNAECDRQVEIVLRTLK